MWISISIKREHPKSEFEIEEGFIKGSAFQFSGHLKGLARRILVSATTQP